MNMESTCDWGHEQWNFVVSQFVKISDQPLSISGESATISTRPTAGPEKGLTFLFPKS